MSVQNEEGDGACLEQTLIFFQDVCLEEISVSKDQILNSIQLKADCRALGIERGDREFGHVKSGKVPLTCPKGID